MATAYLKEAKDGLLKPHSKDIVRLARKDGTPEEAINTLGQLMSTKPHDLYARVLVNARNKLVFHWREETFRHWAKHHSKPSVVSAQGTGVTSMQDPVNQPEGTATRAWRTRSATSRPSPPTRRTYPCTRYRSVQKPSWSKGPKAELASALEG